jgi:hypothetical protein
MHRPARIRAPDKHPPLLRTFDGHSRMVGISPVHRSNTITFGQVGRQFSDRSRRDPRYALRDCIDNNGLRLVLGQNDIAIICLSSWAKQRSGDETRQRDQRNAHGEDSAGKTGDRK